MHVVVRHTVTKILTRIKTRSLENVVPEAVAP